MSVHVFGIRHHGPGSARGLQAELDRLEPDIVLVEGPPDAEGLIPFCSNKDLVPPVAMLVHVVDDPRRAVFYPLACFSPEWHAMRHSLQHGLPCWFIDLPQANRLAEPVAEASGEPAGDPRTASPRMDPLTSLARAAGLDDGEDWWGRMMEERREASGVFDAVLESMTALRSELAMELDRTEARREAHMRQRIREAQKRGFQRIAVVCGAWHAPALNEMPSAEKDDELLQGLKSVSVTSTWIPWSHDRLSIASGYGAGVVSPGWYRHLFTCSSDVEVRWLARVACLLREKDLDASPAQVIEAVRLAECLAAMRGRPVVGLSELDDAAESVLCQGNPLFLRMVHDRLIVDEVLGRVPAETPRVPLQRDIEKRQKRLHLRAKAEERLQELDLRKETDLERSRLLHRLCLLGIDWGEEQGVRGKKGTFREVWRLRWDPELSIRVIEASVWGSCVEEACETRVRHEARSLKELAELTRLLDRVLLSDLSAVVTDIVQRIDELSAVSVGMLELMDALPPLGKALRYGNVHRTSHELVAPIVDALVARIAVGLPGACASLNDPAATEMLSRLTHVHQTIQLLKQPEHGRIWGQALEKLVRQGGANGLIAGRSARLLLDTRSLSSAEAGVWMRRALSRSVPPAGAAAWIEGFLGGSGLLLLHDLKLWAIIEEWIEELSTERFVEVVPLLRRTFATFAPAERRQLGERVRGSGVAAGARVSRSPSTPFNAGRAAEALPLVAKLLGLELPPGDEPRGCG